MGRAGRGGQGGARDRWRGRFSARAKAREKCSGARQLLWIRAARKAEHGQGERRGWAGARPRRCSAGASAAPPCGAVLLAG